MVLKMEIALARCRVRWLSEKARQAFALVRRIAAHTHSRAAMLQNVRYRTLALAIDKDLRVACAGIGAGVALRVPTDYSSNPVMLAVLTMHALENFYATASAPSSI